MGTSGWQYAHWRHNFYAGIPQRRQLEHYCTRFRTVEVNAAFYRLPERDTFANWRDRTPDDEVLAVKASRYLTHVRRLSDPGEPVARLLDRAAGLGTKLGPVLLQLPPTLAATPGGLEATLGAFGGTVPVAVEPRHPSWWSDATRQLLTQHGAALAWADRRSRPITPLWRTADWGYLRLHEGAGAQWPHYGRAALTSWLDRIEQAFGLCRQHDFFVYFNNDPGEAAVANATTFIRMAQRRGFTVAARG